MIGYTVTGATMVLDQATSDALYTGDSDASAVEREIRRDAEALAASLGRRVTVEAANGIEIRRLGAES